MQTVSALYTTLLNDASHWFEARIRINGVYYGGNQIISASSSYRVFNAEQPVVGGCLAAELNVKMIAPSATIPRMAKVEPYVRVCNATQQSEWVPQGVFYIDTRETTHNDNGLDILLLHCYDAMLKAEADFPNTTISFPAKDYRVVQLIAYAMGLQTSAGASAHGGIDPRTKALMNNGSGKYNIALPVGYSMREVLSRIAAMYAGNWIMNYDGKLRLVTLTELPEETNYLIDSLSEAITFGGDRILV